MQISRLLTFVALLNAALAGASPVDELDHARRPFPNIVHQPNVLIVIADDLGVDMLGLYGEGFELACSASGAECGTDDDCAAGETCQSNLAPTPTIDALAASGILFRNAWGYPSCSPMRAAANTGRYGFRNGVGFAGTALRFSEIIIPEALDANSGNTYTHAAIGKWHLGGGVSGPNTHGYSHFAGTPENIASYFNWPRLVDGVQAPATTYATTRNVDDALVWINRQTTPWFMWLAFNAPHGPFHAPPDNLHSYHGDVRPALPVRAGLSCAMRPLREQRLCYSAALEALDTELGRLLTSLPAYVLAKTTVIFIGDNGTPVEITAAPFNPAHAKFSIYQGGIRVPLIISGANVVKGGRESAALVSATDLFATVLSLAGIHHVSTVVPPDVAIDSLSLWPIIRDTRERSRNHVFSEQFRPVPASADGQAIRNVRGFKLMRFPNRTSQLLELYDLRADPFETANLYDEANPALDAEQQAHFDSLLLQLYVLLGLSQAVN